ncbi:MAG: hypothetical protein R2836_06210 [Chitinophagales bacterium]
MWNNDSDKDNNGNQLTANAGGALSADMLKERHLCRMGGSVGGEPLEAHGVVGAGTWANATNPSTATYTAGASESGTITLTLTTSGGSWNNHSNKNNNNKSKLTASAGGALSAICQGATSIRMGGSSRRCELIGGTWSGGAGTWANATNPSTATYTAGASESGTITLTLTTSGGSCGITTATKTITINAPPTASAGGSTTTICSNGTATVSGQPSLT